MMGKNLRSSVSGLNANNATGVNKLIAQLTDRVNLLEKRYSRVMIHQTYFKILDEWLQCMFGVELFPKAKDMGKADADEVSDEDLDNPFYELHMLHHRLNMLEEELQSAGIDVPQIRPRYTKAVTVKTTARKSYGAGQSSAMRRRSINAKPLSPPVLKRAKASETDDDSDKTEEEDGSDGQADKDGIKLEDEKSTGNDKPPVLEEVEKADDQTNSAAGEVEDKDNQVDKEKQPPKEVATKEDSIKMEVDDYYMEEDEEFEQKPDLEDLDYEVARYTQRKMRDARGRKRSAKNNGESSEAEAQDEEDKPVVYTTRGRRHTLPRRYAEFTGHDNVASILKSQQRTSAGGGGKSKKATVDKPKTPSKPKAPPKPIIPKKADGSRPECVYKLIGDVQTKEVDDAGNVTLWDPIPSVKVNQQQLISVIFRSNGMATRLTRKLTTLVFEDQVLANTSPFGTKYYQERLPPEPLEAMVEFISHSGFDSDYTKKKIYMVVGQVCNEARAGRVRKLLPSSASSGSGSGSGTAPSTSEEGTAPTSVDANAAS